jgi:hypothetical protein
MIIKELSTEHPRSTWYIEKHWAAIVEVLKASKQALESVPTDNTSLPFPFTQAHQELKQAITRLEEIG